MLWIKIFLTLQSMYQMILVWIADIQMNLEKLALCAVVKTFKDGLKNYKNTSDFTSFIQEKFQESIGKDSTKKELLSFYLFGLNFKSEKDFEKKIKHLINQKTISFEKGL